MDDFNFDDANLTSDIMKHRDLCRLRGRSWNPADPLSIEGIPEPYRELAEGAKALIEALGRAQEITVNEEGRVERALRAIGIPPDWSVQP